MLSGRGAGTPGEQLDRRGGSGGRGPARRKAYGGGEVAEGREGRAAGSTGNMAAPEGGRPLAQLCGHGGARVGLPTQAGDCSSREEGASDICLLRVTCAGHAGSGHRRAGITRGLDMSLF